MFNIGILKKYFIKTGVWACTSDDGADVSTWRAITLWWPLMYPARRPRDSRDWRRLLRR